MANLSDKYPSPIDNTAWTGNNWTSTTNGISADKIEGALEEVGVRYEDRASALTLSDNGKILQAYYNDDGSTVTQDFRLSDKTVDDIGKGGIEWSTTVASTTIENLKGYLCDASSSAITLTCPASPTIGDVFGVVVLDITNTLSIDGNGNDVAGSTSLELDIIDAGMTFVYTSNGWNIASEINAGKTPTIADNPNDQTGTAYTLQLSDAGKTVYMNNSSTNTVTIPPESSVDFSLNTLIVVLQEGVGASTVQGGTGVTVNGTSGGSETLSGQYQACQLIKRGTDEWIVFGGLA